MRMGISGSVCDNAGASLAVPKNIERLRGLPIFLFSGSENVVYDPESTEASYSILRSQLEYEDYERVVFPGRGHLDCWMGIGCEGDVFPLINDHLKKCTLGDNFEVI